MHCRVENRPDFPEVMDHESAFGSSLVEKA
ncbi:Uncharacterised protein [Vibrio cholerae]|nr:Uncharacterised protein [Vibrio cholerae]